MKRFQNILVGVDLPRGDRLKADSLPATSVQAVQHALWLATLSGARITLMHSLDLSTSDEQRIRTAGREPAVLERVRGVLAAIVEQAERQGVEASFETAVGKSWVELIRRVLTSDHDLVVVGTRNLTGVSRVLIGSTGMKLLRKCPCPVWVAKPSEQQRIHSVLVAHDLTPVGTLALQLGASMAALQGASLQVLHAVEHPEYDDILPSRISSGDAAERQAAARSQIQAELRDFTLAHPPQITLTDDEPSTAILQCVEAERIDLLVMGTVARSGIDGLITGNTAERLLPNIDCSILAVKPAGFVSPVKESS